VIFRELFPRGLTLLDLKDLGVKGMNISNVAARQELRDLIKALNLPDVTVTLNVSAYIACNTAVARILLMAPTYLKKADKTAMTDASDVRDMRHRSGHS